MFQHRAPALVLALALCTVAVSAQQTDRVRTGRVFIAAGDRPDAAPVVVLAYHAWQGLNGGEAEVVAVCSSV